MEETWTIGRVLTWTTSHFAEKGMESPRLDAELLIADALALTRLQVGMVVGYTAGAALLMGGGPSSVYGVEAMRANDGF